MLRNVFLVGAFALAVLLPTSRVSADTMFPAVGDRGDASFNDRCPAHQYLIGVAGRAGTFIDQVQIICAPISANGTHGPQYVGPSRGGGGGTPLEFSCAADSVVNGVTLAMTKNDGHVAWMVLSCTSMRSAGRAKVLFGTANYTPNYQAYTDQMCQAGELANGFNGHFGRDVNALGLDCADRAETAVENSQAQPARAKPIKTTGKPSLVCPGGYVWREASPSDHVCVTPLQRKKAAAQNAAAAAHVSQTDHTSGPTTCASGYVWREAYVGDVVCVTPSDRDAANDENAQAPPQIPK